MMNYQTIVFGAGPAGSVAAFEIKLHDPYADVLLVEKRARPLSQCAGGIGAHIVEKTGYIVPEEVIRSQINKVTLRGPTEECSITADRIGWDQLGWVVDRGKFDRNLLALALEQDVKYVSRVQPRKIYREQDYYIVELANDETHIAKHVIDATGISRPVARMVYPSVNWRRSKIDVHTAIQSVSPNLVGQDDDEIMIIFDPKYAPTGYVWSFPIGGGLSRVGVGVDLEHGPPLKWLKKFFGGHPLAAKTEIGRKISGGLIPTCRPGPVCVDGLALTGDAANFASPLHGGGIIFSMIGSQILGRTIGEGQPLSVYRRKVNRMIGKILKRHYVCKRFLYQLDRSGVDKAIRVGRDFTPKSSDVFGETLRFAKHVLRQDLLGLLISAIRARSRRYT